MKASWQRVLSTSDDFALTVLRISAAVVVWPHGAQKLLGWFGGHGPEGTVGFMGQALGVPPALAWLVIIAEFFGSIALALGLLTRVAALGIFSTLAVAVVMVHLPNGFFMNWTGQQKGEGIEYFLFALPVLAILLWRGAGAWSVDKALTGLGPPAVSSSGPYERGPKLSS
ncbi:MAG: DoxX family protein [Armatimonadetes bacterium]|nr:DoxX family protein [Armatimonadota bacterium]